MSSIFKKARKAQERPSADEPASPPASAELMGYMKDRLDELEKKLEVAQKQALAATVQAKEREAAQRQAQAQMEELLKSAEAARRVRDADHKLQEELTRARDRILDLESKLLERLPSESNSPPVTAEPMDQLKDRLDELEKKLEVAQKQALAATVDAKKKEAALLNAEPANPFNDRFLDRLEEKLAEIDEMKEILKHLAARMDEIEFKRP